MRVDDHYVDKDGNYLGQDGAESDEVRVISADQWNSVNDCSGAACSTEGTTELQKNSTLLDEYDKGVVISDETSKEITEAGGNMPDARIENNSENSVTVLPGSFESGLVTVNPGEKYYGEADGLKTTAHSGSDVYKMVDNTRVSVGSKGAVTVTQSGKWGGLVDWIGGMGVQDSAKFLPKQRKAGKAAVKQGWTNDNKLHYKNWKRLYDARPN